jgi:hypothetical protein
VRFIPDEASEVAYFDVDMDGFLVSFGLHVILRAETHRILAL